MSYYRRPYLSTMAIPSDYVTKREYSYETREVSGGKNFRPTSPYISSYYATPSPSALRRSQRYFPVYEWCPSHDYKYEYEVHRAAPRTYLTDLYQIPTSRTYYSPRYNTGGIVTTIRSGPYGGVTSRTYRY